MSDIDFIAQYMPSTADLTEDDVLDARTRLQQYSNESFPDIESSPGSVLGDLVVTPQAYIITALEKGVSNLLSDLILSNAANNQVFNCDFVQQYLKNFGVDDSISRAASGVVRVTFDENKNYVINRGTQFKFDSYIFTVYLPNSGDFTCFSTGTVVPAGVNGTVLKDTGSGTWFCDIPVLGYSGEEEVSAGTSGSISHYIPELLNINALVQFQSGVNTHTIQDLAKKTQTTMFSASLNTRNGAIQYINSICPFIQSVYAIKNGDRELIRSYHNPFGVDSGCMDVYARSNSYEFTETQQVKLILDEDGEWFEGLWEYTGQPYHIESVTHPSVQYDNLDYQLKSIVDPSYGASAAYSQKEKFSLSVKNVLDSNGDRIFSTEIDSDGSIFTYFTITYQTDPLFPAISQALENTDHAPINVNILVRGYIPVVISTFQIEYVKQAGIEPDLEYASDQIKIYLGNISSKNFYTDASISKIMDQAGASYVKKINVFAKVQWCLGQTITGYDGLEKTPPTTIIRQSDDLRVVYPSKELPITEDVMFSCSPRTVRYYLLENALSFKEVRDV